MGYHVSCWGHHDYLRGCSIHRGHNIGIHQRDIVIHVRDITSTMGVFSASNYIMSTLQGTMVHVGELISYIETPTEPPCIMCVQYRRGCSVPWGISWVPWGDILSTVGVFSNVGGYLEYHGGCSVPWGISWVPWRMFSIVGGKIFCYLSTPRYWTPPTVLMISPHMYHDIPPRYSNFKGWYPPTVLNTPHGTHDIPHMHHDIPPHASWYPPRYWTSPMVLKITPHGTHDIPHGTEHPHGTQDIPPRYSWYPSTVLNTPHGTEHPPRYCTHIIQGAEHPLWWTSPILSIPWCTNDFHQYTKYLLMYLWYTTICHYTPTTACC